MNYTKLSIIIKTDKKPPYFIGSQLRGALGYALKKVSCINPSYKCDGCFATNNCLYYQFYEEKNSFHKYRFDFELGLEYYNFDFYLFNDVCDKLPYVVSAFLVPPLLRWNAYIKLKHTKIPKWEEVDIKYMNQHIHIL